MPKKTHKIVDTTKDKVEHIKHDAKEYYKWKNMISRYIIIWFLLILVILQFILPSLDKSKSKDLDSFQDNWKLENALESSNVDTKFLFLWNEIDTNNVEFDTALTDIISDLPALRLLYKKSLLYLPSLETKLLQAGLPLDLQYASLSNWLYNPIWMFSQDTADAYGLRMDGDIDETLNADKSTDAIITYLDDLYDIFGDRDLALIWYFIWEEELEDIMKDQNIDSFQDLYLETYLQGWYYNVLAYKYVMENISNYIDIQDISAYPQADTETIELKETKDLAKRANKAWYTFKEIKELNPWILGYYLPRGKWKVKVYSD